MHSEKIELETKWITKFHPNNKMKIEIINSAIIEGLKKALWENIRFLAILNPTLKPEYLLTVNVAQQIHSTDSKLEIRLEAATKNLNIYYDFSNPTSGLFKTDGIIKQPGRIDMIIYNQTTKVVWPIEIKGFLSKNGVRKDVERLQQLLSPDFIRLKTKIEVGILAFVVEKRYKHFKFEEGNIEDWILEVGNKIHTEYNEFLLPLMESGLDLKINIQDIYNTGFEDFDNIGSLFSPDDIEDRLSEISVYYGIVINIEKKDTRQLSLHENQVS